MIIIYIAPGQGQTALRGQSFNVNRNVLSLHTLEGTDLEKVESIKYLGVTITMI